MAVHLPLLARLFVASPCTAEWSEMAGDDRARHCGKCKQTVYNLSDMTREAAEALLFEKNGDLCVRYFARRDGTILTQDCSVGVKQARKRKLVAAGAALLASVGAAGGTAMHMLGHDDSQRFMGSVGFADEPVPVVEKAAPPQPDEGQYVMGGISAPPPLEVAPVPHEPVHLMMGQPIAVDPPAHAKRHKP